jgi:serine phosphatase RsbU (regulator of sigma subunit)
METRRSGCFTTRRYHQHFIRFEKGQVLVIYTDGITEAANANDEEYGQERFAKSVLAGIELPAKKLIDHIRKDVAGLYGKEVSSMTTGRCSS